MKFLLSILVFLCYTIGVNAQGLENIIVETYYVSDANDATDTDGGFLESGSVTYRVFVDMAPGYELQAVYGNSSHPLSISTSTLFFNNEDRGEQTGNMLPDNRLDENTVALDSYVTMSAGSTLRLGIPKSMDTDGSVVGGVNNDGGSQGIAGGLLANNDPLAGIPLTSADGLISGVVPTVTVVGMDLSIFNDVNDGPIFTSSGGAWSVLEGVQGPTSENIVLIAQLTTTGELEFHLNVQLGTPDGEVEQYVSSNPEGDEQFFNPLNFPLLPIPGCTSSTACNYDPIADEDDGSCIEPVAQCQICNGTNDGLVLVDTDGDGICDAEEVPGCTSSETACNYNPNATDEAACIEPVEGCLSCNENNDGLVLVDADGDGICDAEEMPGCTSDSACNYSPDATDDDGSCIEPVPDCEICNENNDGLILVDSDEDGICDALENPGCLSPTACNYDPESTSDDGSCIEPQENCSICNENNDGLILIDSDEDGVCDAEEVSGCMSETACNYDPLATDEDGSCIEPIADCLECNINNDGLVLIDTDGDGICDAEEIPGCTNPEACNFNPEATEEDDSCIVPVPDCLACNDDNTGLDLIDSDGDGICDGEEIFGCTDPEALNYNPDATEDDGSCIYTNVEEHSPLSNIQVYPNPASEAVRISMSGKVASGVKAELFNLIGQVVWSRQMNVGPGQTSYLVDVSVLNQGIYFLRLTSGELESTTRLLID